MLDGERHVVDDRQLAITLGQATQLDRCHALASSTVGRLAALL
jgi:hypothetical protein